MKKFIYRIMAVGFMAAAFVSCDQEKDPDPIMDASSKPTITINRIDDDGDINEGDTLVYEITTDKMLAQGSVEFVPEFSAESGVDENDYIVEGGVLATYSNSTTLTIIIVEDNVPEVNEVFDFQILAPEIAQNWQLSPQSEVESVDATIANVNDAGGLTIAFAWDDPEHHTDFDLLVISEEFGPWSADGATGNNPEIDMTIRHDYEDGEYDGTYYVGIDPYDVPDDVTSYTISVGHPDGTVEIFQGTFDQSLLDTYPTDLFAHPSWNYDIYRILVVEKTGDDYTVDYVLD